MDNSLRALCDALKKVLWQLKPQQQPLSFLILTGCLRQGKTTLLKQSHFQHITVNAEKPSDIYYNQQGVILELGEAWLTQSKTLLQYTLKQLNQCHRHLKITGIILCIDVNELLGLEPLEFAAKAKVHAQLLTRFGLGLNYRLETAIIFTKLDAVAGFSEFFQNDHASELTKPLGFSIDWGLQQNKIVSNYSLQFDSFIEMLGQQVIHKMHPARSSIKRTLIREFPLQLSTLCKSIQLLIHAIPYSLFHIHALYFTSSEQGGVSLDCLNKKIKNEYPLVVQDRFPQSNNYKAYFIEGALQEFQQHTKQPIGKSIVPQKWVLATAVGIAVLSLTWLGRQYYQSTKLLDEVSKDLITYDTLAGQSYNHDSALYHLAKASDKLEKVTANSLYLPTVQQLKSQLRSHTKQNLHSNFIPTLLAEIEQTMLDSKQTQAARYEALKIYLMLGDSTHFQQTEVLNWFKNHWQAQTDPHTLPQKMALLKQALGQPLQAMTINRQIVSDIRNYLNALPLNYLYYTLAKSYFPQQTQPLQIAGFDLAEQQLPAYYTKSGFKKVLDALPNISKQLQKENWVLARQDLNNLADNLRQAYCYEYAVWWQNLMRRSFPNHFQNYQQGRVIADNLQKQDAIGNFIRLIQKETAPEPGEQYALFNQEIASKFTDLTLVSHSALRELALTMSELEKFLATLAFVNDQGKTAFSIARTRFEGDNLSSPLSALYQTTRQLPEPVAGWVKQIADESWYLVINDCKAYLNTQWHQLVITDYQTRIANRYPFEATQAQDVNIADFDHFFGRSGTLNNFIEQYLKPFLDTSQAQWQPKEVNNYVLPISTETINELIRANVITNMFFPEQSNSSNIEFSLQKLNLDPVVANLQLIIGNTKLSDSQSSEETEVRFHWPQSNARLTLKSIDGQNYELDELGPWAFFKILQKVNVLVDEQDSSSLQILFEVNGNSGRYVLKTQNQINPFIPGILNGFSLNETLA